jgi:hypothetical protein
MAARYSRKWTLVLPKHISPISLLAIFPCLAIPVSLKKFAVPMNREFPLQRLESLSKLGLPEAGKGPNYANSL